MTVCTLRGPHQGTDALCMCEWFTMKHERVRGSCVRVSARVHVSKFLEKRKMLAFLFFFFFLLM